MKLSELEDKVKELLLSGNKESIDLAMASCKVLHPMLWSLLGNISGPLDGLNVNSLAVAARHCNISIGQPVRYKGLEGSPIMVISEINVRSYTPSFLSTTKHYGLTINAKYYNKSKQEFQSVQDRVECFEVLSNDKEEEKQEGKE